MAATLARPQSPAMNDPVVVAFPILGGTFRWRRHVFMNGLSISSESGLFRIAKQKFFNFANRGMANTKDKSTDKLTILQVGKEDFLKESDHKIKELQEEL
ncbi:hypothetical protein LTR84_001168 [Exophiala bonariae]|uniref:Uncharacterized protein n=1 Tax=Exophiala bonariae TaxID=1690606 RepID=A0AAV9NV89_9EURO|nr:hypothetical protein LTR84_001168 [Exophiala bonariae]